jgi:hypothetical protein
MTAESRRLLRFRQWKTPNPVMGRLHPFTCVHLLCAVALILMGMAWGDALADSPAMDLDAFKWKNRLIFLFAPHADDPMLDALRREISSRPQAVKERDLVVFEILESGDSRMDATPIGPQTATLLRERFGIPPETFTLILVGKDGGVKLRRNDYVELEAVFALIDSMPMRRNEMRRKGQGD